MRANNAHMCGCVLAYERDFVSFVRPKDKHAIRKANLFSVVNFIAFSPSLRLFLTCPKKKHNAYMEMIIVGFVGFLIYFH